MSRLSQRERIKILPLSKQLLFEKIEWVGVTFFPEPKTKMYLGK